MTQITNFLPLFDETKIPQKTGNQTNEEFMENADYCTAFIPSLITTVNSAMAEANILAEECNDAALTCIAGSNFRGLWSNITGPGVIGDSVYKLVGDTEYWILVVDVLSVENHVPGVSTVFKPWSVHIDSVNVLATLTPSSAATVEITSVITSVYSKYEIELQNVIPATDAVSFFVRTSSNNGATWDSGSSDYDWYTVSSSVTSTPADGEMRPIGVQTVGSDTNETGLTGTMILHNPSNTTKYKTLESHMSYIDTSGVLRSFPAFCRRLSTAAITGVQLAFHSGNIESGTIIVRGYK